MKDFRRLEVAHDLTLKVYAASRRFPREEIFGVTSQLRRSAASIPYNICEGCGLGTDAAFANALQTSYGSSSELDYQLFLAHELGYLPANVYRPMFDQLQRVQRMLASLIAKVRTAEGVPARA